MKEKPTVGSPIFGVFPSDYIPTVKRMSMYISLFTVAIHVNDNSEFQELFEATMDKCTMG